MGEVGDDEVAAAGQAAGQVADQGPRVLVVGNALQDPAAQDRDRQAGFEQARDSGVAQDARGVSDVGTQDGRGGGVLGQDQSALAQRDGVVVDVDDVGVGAGFAGDLVDVGPVRDARAEVEVAADLVLGGEMANGAAEESPVEGGEFTKTWGQVQQLGAGAPIGGVSALPSQ
ncbi:hypothetical protein ACS04_22595 [Streptomyces roseus]|uniref:Uncharacterized protein n=1 Tax=Streptomyces roseus TaxID=66430 RepID=A0A0J6XN08_9ACTN|nr:hypothetical protein ACS04_22595 [Streptomyces roseus]